MTALLIDNLPLLAGAPNGIKKLRELILELAVRGKLVPQDPGDEPASELLKRIAEEKARLVAEGKIKKQKPLTEVGEGAEPFELPAGWKWSSLAQVAFVNPRNAAADSLEVSFVPMTFIGTRFDDQHGQEPRLWGEVKQGFTHFAEGDIGVAKITPCFENSKACVFSNLMNGLGAGTTELHIVRPANETLDPRYVLAYLKSPQFLLVGETKMTGTAGQKRLPKDFVEVNPFPLPPLAEQHRIVAKVDELMALCDRLDAQQADAKSAHAQMVEALLNILTQASDADEFAANWQRLAEHFHTLFTTEPSIGALKQTLLQLAVMGKLVQQDPSDEPAGELLGRVIEEKARLVAEGKIKKQKVLPEIGEEERAYELPQGWQWVRKAEVFSFLNGYAFKSEWFRPEGIRLLRNVNISHGVINWKETACISEEQAAELQGFSLDENDVVLTLDRPIISTGLKYAVIRSADLPCLLLQRVAKIAPYAGAVTVSYLSAWLNSRFFVDSIDPGRSNGVPHISTNQVASMPFALPPLAEQHRIAAKLDQLMALCDQLKTHLTKARQLNEQLASTLVEQAVA